MDKVKAALYHERGHLVLIALQCVVDNLACRAAQLEARGN